VGLGAANTVVADHVVILPEISTIVLEITTRITIAQRILAFLVRSKNQCTPENGKEGGEFDEVVVSRAIAMGGVLKPESAKGHCS